MHMQVYLMWWAEAPVTVAHIINRAPTINRPALFTWEVLADEKAKSEVPLCLRIKPFSCINDR